MSLACLASVYQDQGVVGQHMFALDFVDFVVVVSTPLISRQVGEGDVMPSLRGFPDMVNHSGEVIHAVLWVCGTNSTRR